MVLCSILWVQFVMPQLETDDYHTIEEALCRSTRTIGTANLLLHSNITYLVHPGEFCVVENSQNIHIYGNNPSSPTLVKCLAQNSSYSSRGFAFINVSNLTIENIIFNDCGGITVFDTGFSFDATLSASLFCNHCVDVTLRNIIITNYWGFAFVGCNLFGDTYFDRLVIRSNRNVNISSSLCYDNMLGHNVCIGSGMLFDFFDSELALNSSEIVVQDSDFIDNHYEHSEMYDEKCTDVFFYDSQALLNSFPGVGAMTIMFEQTLFSVSVTIERSKFVNNKGICYGSTAAFYLGLPSLSTLNISNSLFLNNVALYSDILSNQNFFGSAITIFMMFLEGRTEFYNCTIIQDSTFTHDCTDCSSALFISISQLPLSNGFCRVTLDNLTSKSDILFLRAESVGAIRQLLFHLKDLKLFGLNQHSNSNNSYHGVIELLNIQEAVVEGSSPTSSVFKDLVGPVISVTKTFLFFRGNVSFQNNFGPSWTNGAAIQLYDSFLSLVEPTTLFFDSNVAVFGGAIYSYGDEQLSSFCSIQYSTNLIYTLENVTKMDARMIFRKNSAVLGGNSVYVGNLYNCSVRISKGILISSKHVDAIYDAIFVFEETVENHLQEVSSVGENVCLCLSNDSFDCTGRTYLDHPLHTYPGKTIYLNMIALDKVGKPVYSTIFANVGRNFPYNNDLDWNLAYGQDVILMHKSNCKNVSFNILSINNTNTLGILSTYVQGSDKSKSMDIPVFLQRCPLGLQKPSGVNSCTCSALLQKFGVTCDVNEGTVTIPPTSWIGAIDLDINATALGFSNHCPIDFCKPKVYTLPLESSTICSVNREGVLCGRCSPPYSEVIGDYQCQKCSNWWLLLIIVYAVVGVLLVFLLFYLNLTLTSGTINGVIFYANFLYINRIRFLGTPGLIWLQIFFSFINLRLGFPLCLYDGMTTIVSSHLSFVFPFYLWIIAISLVVISRYSNKVSDLFGRSAVHVLATLIHLSYSTLLASTVDGLVVNDVTIELERGEIFNHKVWYLDGNLTYLADGHLTLFMLSIINLVFILLPYTILLTGIRIFSRLRIVNRFMPLIDVYCAPYKDKWRFWFGARLIVLVVLYTGSALLRNHISSLYFMKVVVLVCFTIAQLVIMPFKNYFINLLDGFFLVNAIFLSATALYTLNEIDNLRKGTSTLVGLAFLVSLCVLVYHIWDTRCKRCKITRKLTYNRISEGAQTVDHELNTEIDTTQPSQPVTFHVLSYHPEKLRESLLDSGSGNIQESYNN